MKHYKIIIILILTLSIMLIFHDFRQIKSCQPGINPEQTVQKVNISIENLSAKEIKPTEYITSTVSTDAKLTHTQQLNVKLKLLEPVAVTYFEPILKILEEQKNMISTEAINTRNSEKNLGIKIIQVALMDDSEGLGDIIYLPDKTYNTVRSNINAFQIEGNDDNQILTVVVNTEYENRIETIQILKWDNKNPNEFFLHNPLGIETTCYSLA